MLLDGDGDGVDDPRCALEVSLQVSTLALSGVGCRDVCSHLLICDHVPQGQCGDADLVFYGLAFRSNPPRCAF